ncbi:uncharacterized protein BT62DRAFT_927075 [Guyanagaster necrorhizus]|uniref:Uncharacterized protein n=1 Tax=Guyanagaster necrorhizus TaxID=856835 RepID=A0A9P7W4X6_9AGAR|nr:uncharacterized protein BT62DRAFT_927075 [Guyanagaster necrorhizus MCA 3950]KAG7451376.1 hypothetical protein BT62DRAFT_927075 [Guyanagaster necrorhizus MCA 3950]
MAIHPVPGPAYAILAAANGSNPQLASYSIAQAVSSLSSSANNFQASSLPVSNGARVNTVPNTAFKAPAHKHAHHLHSIPPREKSTRTLIIDHMLWVHGRTRFAQARAELGMTDRTGGPRSTNYIHRRRPENFEEEEELGSDGEDVVMLKTRAAGRHHDPLSDVEEEQLRTQDLGLARSLRLRAEDLEKVVLSMLEQPPPLLPIPDEDILTPPTSPQIHPSNQRTGSHPHTLPNGVRLRLALGVMINDLFARHAPPPPFRHQRSHQPNSPAVSLTPSDISSVDPTYLPTPSHLPPALTTVSSVSAYSPLVPGYNQCNYPPKTPIKPTGRIHALYLEGADPSTANSPPAFRCPRHLHTGCEICVGAKSSMRVASGRGRSNSTGVPGVGERTTRMGPAPTWKGTTAGMSPDGGGITGWKDGSGIGSGLARTAAGGSVLRRNNLADEVMGSGIGTGSGNTKLSDLIPRFLRLSALAAAELGREKREEAGFESPRSKDGDGGGYMSAGERSHENGRMYGELSPLPSPAHTSTSRAIADAQNRLYGVALRPSRQWYMLLAGLLTRAVLEGYLTAGWRGSHAVECLLTVGLGIIEPVPGREAEPDQAWQEFNPDEMPSLSEAARVLFPGLRQGAPLRKGAEEQEFEMEMDERLRRFYDIPASTPDLSTHMEDLAWQYPAEPVERAAVRFCEAIAKWRGKPELETKSQPLASNNGSSSAMTIESLVHSNPVSPSTSRDPLRLPPRFRTNAPTNDRQPNIEVYFIQPQYSMSGYNNAWGWNKRLQSPEDDRSRVSKRAHV